MRLISVIRKFARGTDDMGARYAGDLLCPCGGVRFHIVIAGGTVFIVQAALQAVVGQRQIVNGGHQRSRTVGQLQAFHRQLVHQHVFQRHFIEVFGAFAAEVREADVGDIVLAAEHAQAQFSLFTGGTVTLFEVPFALLTPAEAD
ncbi:hypothetical protein D3C75_426850 [compost metagenome]